MTFSPERSEAIRETLKREVRRRRRPSRTAVVAATAVGVAAVLVIGVGVATTLRQRPTPQSAPSASAVPLSGATPAQQAARALVLNASSTATDSFMATRVHLAEFLPNARFEYPDGTVTPARDDELWASSGVVVGRITDVQAHPEARGWLILTAKLSESFGSLLPDSVIEFSVYSRTDLGLEDLRSAYKTIGRVVLPLGQNNVDGWPAEVYPLSGALFGVADNDGAIHFPSMGTDYESPFQSEHEFLQGIETLQQLAFAAAGEGAVIPVHRDASAGGPLFRDSSRD